MGPPCSTRRLQAWGRHCAWKRPTPIKSRSPSSAPCLERWPSASSATPSSRPINPRSRASRWPAARPPQRPPPPRPLRPRSFAAGAARQGRRRQGPERRQDLSGLPQLRQGRRRQGRTAAMGRRRPAGRFRRRLRLFGRRQGDRRQLGLTRSSIIGSPSLPRWRRAPRWPSPANPRRPSAPTSSPICRSSRTARFRSRNRREGERELAKATQGRPGPFDFFGDGHERAARRVPTKKPAPRISASRLLF